MYKTARDEGFEAGYTQFYKDLEKYSTVTKEAGLGNFIRGAATKIKSGGRELAKNLEIIPRDRRDFMFSPTLGDNVLRSRIKAGKSSIRRPESVATDVIERAFSPLGTEKRKRQAHMRSLYGYGDKSMKWNRKIDPALNELKYKELQNKSILAKRK